MASTASLVVERALIARPDEVIKLTFLNPDVVPHNWVLIKDGSLAKVGDLVNKIVADPEAVVRHYVPQSDDVPAWTDMVTATINGSFSSKLRRSKAATPSSAASKATGWW